MIHINYIAVIIAVVVNFIIGSLWYSVLFGKAWAKEHGFDSTVKPKGSEMARGMIFMVIGNFLMVFVLAHNAGAWSFVPETSQMTPVQNVLSSAIFTWLGFFLPFDINTVAWERKSWKLFAINTSYHFVILLVASAILIMM